MFSYQLQEAPARAEADAAQRPAQSSGTRGETAEGPPAAPSAKPPMESRRNLEARASAAKRPPPWHGLEQEPVQKWLERLTDLRKQGRTTEAEELLAEIKRRFPDHPLPAGVE